MREVMEELEAEKTTYVFSFKEAAEERGALKRLLSDLGKWKEAQQRIRKLHFRQVDTLRDLLKNKPKKISWPDWYHKNIDIAEQI